MGKNYRINYTLDYEPADIETLGKMLKHHSPFIPTVNIEDFETEVTVKLGDVPTAIDKRNSMVWAKVANEVYRFKLFHTEPITNVRYGYKVIDIMKISDHQYIVVSDMLGINFEAGEVSSKQFNKIIGQYPILALRLGLI